MSMTSLSMLTATLVAMMSVTHGVTDQDRGRTFILNPDSVPWEEAGQRCQGMDGHLGTIDGIHVVPELDYDGEWTFWVGLKVTSSDNLTWEDGTKVDWTNWRENLDQSRDLDLCVSVVTSAPYLWQLATCNKSLPSLCEIAEGSCRFTVIPHASLTAWNDRLVTGNNDTCLQLCRAARDLDCRSVEVNRHNHKCQFSTQTRWTQPQAFYRGSSRWDYYHWTCVNGTYLSSSGGVSPNGIDLPDLQPTTLPPSSSSSSSAPQEITEEGEEEVVCKKVKKTPSANETSAVEKEVQHLQTLAKAYKQQSRMKKKISTPNTRQSATYVGSLAVALVLVVLGVIVCLDILSLHRFLHDLHRHGAPCGKCAKLLKKKQPAGRRKRVQFSDFPQSFSATPHPRTPVFAHSRFPRHFRPLALTEDPHLESIYSQQAQETLPGTLDIHLDASLEYERLSDTLVPCSKQTGTMETSELSQSGCSSSAQEQSVFLENSKHGRPRNEEQELVVIERNPEHSFSGDFTKHGDQHLRDGTDSTKGWCQGETQHSEQVMEDFIRSDRTLTDAENPNALCKIPLPAVFAEKLASDAFTCESHSHSGNASQLPSQEPSDTQESRNEQSVLELENLPANTDELQCDSVKTSGIVVNVTDNVQTSGRQAGNLNAVTEETVIETEVDNNFVVRF